MQEPIDKGRAITETIRRILRWCEAVGERIQFAGEGGERRFRYWLMRELLEGELGWPVENTAQGERFDITLLDDNQHPIITIETKTPYHLASAREKRDFEGRLAALPTLRYAIFTNGVTWQRYLIDPVTRSPIEEDGFTLGSHTELSVFNFFNPLRYAGVTYHPPQGSYRIARGETFLSSSLLRLTADMEAMLADGILFYQRLFYGFREGLAGSEVQAVTSNIYERWAGDSLHLRPSQIAGIISERYVEAVGTDELLDLLAAYDFKDEVAQQVAESILNMSTRDRRNAEKVVLRLWPLFEKTVQQLCAQTAHVQIARLLLYRIGEDEGVFESKLSGSQLTSLLKSPHADVHGRRFPVTEQIENIRQRMQDFLPSVYVLSEFDWWMVKSEMRPILTPKERAWLLPFDEDLDQLLSSSLTRLGSYKFEAVDLDAWRNLYENYLPPDERQRLGGFYTPDPLVNLTLDLAGYTPEADGLCKLSYIDPACGSGAFVSTALGRLQQHLDLKLPCHQELHSRQTSSAQKIEARLRMIERAVHGIDIHPFASFLTTLNVLFIVLPSYVKAREGNPDFSLSLGVYAWDALDTPGVSASDQGTLAMWTGMNSRIQRSNRDHEEYRKLITGKFDRVFGNPPWGGVLKGPLAPVYDAAKKRAFASTYPQAAQGKYDIYGLFMERAVRLLKDRGAFALITQSTFLDKEWASGLRGLLSTEVEIEWIVEMNPFGQLFFSAMNAPCITIAQNILPKASHLVRAIRSEKTPLIGDGRLERQTYVTSTLRSIAHTLETESLATLNFASALQIPQTTLASTASNRWNLARVRSRERLEKGWSASGLFEVRQGVTPGNALDVFLLESKQAKHLKLEKALVHKAVKSRDLQRWSVPWNGLELLYPYHKPKNGDWVPAFTLDEKAISQLATKTKVHSSGLKDGLDFDISLDEYERSIIQKRGINPDALEQLLNHRIAEGLITYPETARYLVQHYKNLEKRVFKHRNIRKFNRRWYEYLWPRDPEILFSKIRILSPTLMRNGRFVLDESRHLSDHACLFLQPTEKTRAAWIGLRDHLAEALRGDATQRDVFLYCLAHLNSPIATRALTEGRQPTPMGSYQISEKSLSEVVIPLPKKSAKAIITATEALVVRTGVLQQEDLLEQERKLFALL